MNTNIWWYIWYNICDFREVFPVPHYIELGSKPEWTYSLARQDHMFLLVPRQQWGKQKRPGNATTYCWLWDSETTENSRKSHPSATQEPKHLLLTGCWLPVCRLDLQLASCKAQLISTIHTVSTATASHKKQTLRSYNLQVGESHCSLSKAIFVQLQWCHGTGDRCQFLILLLQ